MLANLDLYVAISNHASKPSTVTLTVWDYSITTAATCVIGTTLN